MWGISKKSVAALGGLAAAVTVAIAVAASTPALAQEPNQGSVTGTVRTSNGAALAGASVALRGPVNETNVSDAHGAFAFTALPPGGYRIIVTKGGFFQYQSSISVAAATTVVVNVSLAPSSFSSLKTIAQVSTNAPGRVAINQSTASISTISHQTFADQGLLQVTKALNETPGIIAWGSPENNNGADQGSPQVVQIRGALPYETSSLIDGHPAPISLTGTFNPIYLNPALLQSVEVVKGPGYMGPEINYAIGGAVNYITLEPTQTPEASLTLGQDTWGGFSTAFTATGSTPSHVVDYAFGYATNGSPGPLQNYQVAGSQLYLFAGEPFSYRVNGLSAAFFPEVIAPAPARRYYRYIGTVGSYQFAQPLYVCCWGLNTAYHANSQLGKIRINLSPSSSFTISYLGAQSFSDLGGVGATSLSPVGSQETGSFSVFAPPAGYSGSVAPGTQIPFDLSAFQPENQSVQQNLYQGEFRTSLGAQWTALARYFTSANTDYVYLDTPENAPYVFGGKTWGGVPLCPKATTFDPSSGGCNPGNVAPQMTYFNGQETTFSTFNATNQSLENDHLRGMSLLFERPSQNGGDFTISLDRSSHFSYAFSNIPTSGLPPQYPLPQGASQTFDTQTIRDRLFLAPHVFASISDYFIQYSSHYTDDGGATWFDATRGYNAPRFGVTWQPNSDTSLRFATGASIAPPYLSLLSSPGSAPEENITGVPSAGYTENLNNGDIAPETAFGYDVGIDRRIQGSISVSADVYLTNLFNMYLPSTYLISDNYMPPGSTTGYPLYGSITENLGRARYEGIEIALQNAPAVGWGFKVQGSLQRAYAYNLPPGFYCTNVPASECTPLHYSTNLGIIPGVNFQASGLGWNTINGVSVPYSMGYAEVNYRSRHGLYFNLGTTYFGPNNSYSLPAFWVFSGAIRQQLRPGTALQFSVDNLFDAYGRAWTSYFGGLSAPLQPQCIGKYGTPYQGLSGTACAALAPAADRVVIPQLGPTIAGNYGPPTLRFQLIQQLGSIRQP